MLEAIKKLGDVAMSSGQNFLEALALPLEAKRGDKDQYLVIIKIDTQNASVAFQPVKIDDYTAQRYIWVGNADGSNTPQWYATTNNLKFIVGQAIPNLIKKLPDNTSLKVTLQDMLDNMYYDLGPQNGAKNRYRYVWDLGKMGMAEALGYDTAYIQNGINDIKKMPERVASAVLDYIKIKNAGAIKSDEIALWTLQIDGKLVVDDRAYRQAVGREKIDVIFQNAIDGVCSACGKSGKVTDKTTKLTFKYYNTDKKGFSSYVSGRFDKNFVLCRDCYMALLEGEAYIKNRFNTRLGGLNLYLIPSFIFDVSFTADQLDEWTKYINDSFNSAKTASAIKDFEKSIIDDYMAYEDEKNNYILNLMFYQRNQAELKVLKLIKDVPPSRFTQLRAASGVTGRLGDVLFGPSPMWEIDLNKIYYLIPINVDKDSKDSVEYRKLLDIYDDIFSGKPVSYEFLVDSFVKLARIYRLGNSVNVNIRISGDADIAMVYAMVQANLFMEYLRQLKLLERGVSMDSDKLILKDDIKGYIEEMGYDEPKTALFLLGYLIGQVADGQRSSGMDNKPVLDKLNYQGMTKLRVWRLSDEVFEKLRQYKRFAYNEGIFAQHRMLMEKYISNWPLTDQENVFYILSGYAYNTLAAIKAAKERNNNNEGVVVNE
ncbi:TIGR02556 family CRISPR-associated protein [Mahella sp.]|uniref:TIGR02556 family CRISPR-associated protein n=1 Tax=Mahella sp. TaxID=2798721 RepID=UPI0025B9E9EA|nr:TIGR02556 family CRISPR-associated protein [Mahella sp.]MBZ4665033.1 CRISPR-associated protein Csh1 family [Mahella sp.]